MLSISFMRGIAIPGFCSVLLSLRVWGYAPNHRRAGPSRSDCEPKGRCFYEKPSYRGMETSSPELISPTGVNPPDRPLANLTSHETTFLIQQLRSRSDYTAIVHLVDSCSGKNSHIFTSAIGSLCRAMPSDALELFKEMEACQIEPSPETMAAVMTAVAHLHRDLGTIRSWQLRLEADYPGAWSSSSKGWDATISSFRYVDDPECCDASILLLRRMKIKGLELTTSTYQHLFQVCAAHLNTTMAEVLLEELVTDRPVQLSSRLWSSALQVFALSGSHECARKVLHLMAKHGHNVNVHHYTAYLKSLSPNTEHMIKVLFHMRGWPKDHLTDLDGLPPAAPDLVAIKTVLRSCRLGDYATARQLLWLVQNGEFCGVRPDEQAYNLVLASCDEPEAARMLIKEMRLSRRYRQGVVPPSLATYTQAIVVCKRAADLKTALLFLQQAQDDGLNPDVVMYTAAICTAARAADLFCAKKLIREMRSRGCAPNSVTYNGLIAACLTCGQTKEAVDSYIDMVRDGITPTPQTFQLFARQIRLVASINDKLNMLTRIYETMTADQMNVETSGSIIELLIGAYATSGVFDKAKSTFDAIVGPADVSCLRAILFACSAEKTPRWEEALSILHGSDISCGTLPPAYVDPLALSYTMLACSKANQWEESFRLLQLYGNKNTSLRAVNSLIGACGRCGRPDMAMAVLNGLSDYGIEPDELSFRNAIIACNQAEHRKQFEMIRDQSSEINHEGGGFEWWECALSLIRRMNERGLRPDVQSYSSAISACEAASQWQPALAILQSLLDEDNEDHGLKLNLYCFNAAISACAKGGAWVEALEVYERMKAQGDARLQPNIVTMGSLMEGLDRAGQKELAQRIYGEGLHKKVLNPWRTTRASTGDPILVMDLHQFSAAMARAAIRYQMDALFLNKKARLKGDWVIVVGKGLRSEEEPVLLPTVVGLLQSEYGIDPKIDKENAGRLLVSSKQMKLYIGDHR